MNAFAVGVTRIFADPNMAADALWLAGGVPPAVPVRVIRKAPDEVTNFGPARLHSETVIVDVLVSELPSPEPGDRIMIGDEVFEVQGEPARDRERLVWTIDLRPT